MSNKIIKKQTKNNKIIKKSAWIFMAVIGVLVLLATSTKIIQANQPEPVTYPEAISFSYNPETREVETEDLGENFEWNGYWTGVEESENE